MDYKLIKIGAHKGGVLHTTLTSTDRVIMVEPVKEIYDILKQKINTIYPDNNFIFLNLAVSNFNGYLKLYVPDIRLFDQSTEPWYIQKEYVNWIDQLSSVNKHHVLDHLLNIPVIQRNIECVTLESIIKKYDVTSVQYLVTDTEGSDYEVLSGLQSVNPDNIIFESKHIDGTNKPKGKKYKSIIDKFTPLYSIIKQDREDTYLCKNKRI